MCRLLFTPGSEVIAIGNPSTRIGPEPQVPLGRRRADYWLPAAIGVEPDAGTRYDVLQSEWKPYFDHVANWSWIVTGETFDNYPAETYLQPVTDQAHGLRLALEPVAEARYPKPMAVRVHLAAIGFPRAFDPVTGVARFDMQQPEVVKQSRAAVWLPAPDRVSVAEAIDTLLTVQHGVREQARVPDWVAPYTLPTEVPIAAEIASLETERVALNERIADARARAAEAARPRQLLYEKGKDVLDRWFETRYARSVRASMTLSERASRTGRCSGACGARC
jgi:hypothetical protein